MIDLYTLATPNGQKASIALEEIALPYNAHTINILQGEQFEPEFVAISPNSKIPVIVDQHGPDGRPLAIMESGAILTYLADKSGMLWPHDPRERNEALQWLFFQVGHIGPMFGQFGHFFRYARDRCDHPYPLERYTKEAKRLLSVLETRLAERNYLMTSGYSMVDIATYPWVRCLEEFYGAGDTLELDSFGHVRAWMGRCSDRPAVQRGLAVGAIDAPS